MSKNRCKKYVMIVTSEDERYNPEYPRDGGVPLLYFADNPWEGIFECVIEGNDYNELMNEAAKKDVDGLFYQLYENENGKRIGYGSIDPDIIHDEIIESEKANKLMWVWKNNNSNNETYFRFWYNERKEDLEFTHEWDYLTSVRCGELCFDLIQRYDKVWADLYVGNVKDIYACGSDGTPYDFLSDVIIKWDASDLVKLSYDEMKSKIVKELNDFVTNNKIIVTDISVKEITLLDKAKQPLHFW